MKFALTLHSLFVSAGNFGIELPWHGKIFLAEKMYSQVYLQHTMQSIRLIPSQYSIDCEQDRFIFCNQQHLH